MKKLTLITFVFAGMILSVAAQTNKPAPTKPASPAKMSKPAPMAMNGTSPTAKGKWLLGTNLSVRSSNGEGDYKTMDLDFNPRLSYFIKENLALGLVFGVGSYKSEIAGQLNNKSTYFQIAPSARYYLPIGNRFMFVGELSVPIGSQTNTDANLNETKSQVLGVELSPSFVFFPSNRISIEMKLGSVYWKNYKQGDETSSELGLQVFGGNQFSPSFGFNFHLGK
ncbi:MAG: hypothetical protein ACKOW2_04890 [Sphingobacteriaceae bacterium]